MSFDTANLLRGLHINTNEIKELPKIQEYLKGSLLTMGVSEYDPPKTQFCYADVIKNVVQVHTLKWKDISP